MRIAFVGVKRKYWELPPEYRDPFNQYHLELPYYYAKPGNSVTVTTVDYHDAPRLVGRGDLVCIPEGDSGLHEFDVVIHWRKWFPEFYHPEAVNVINCQDHTFSKEWRDSVQQAFNEKKLYGILCFPGWHKRNLQAESCLPQERLLDGVTLGVDTEVYRPSPGKDPYQMLWASDPGRGLDGAIGLAIQLFHRDKRFRLHVCHPDYARGNRVNHPAIIWHGNVNNGPKLWDLFNTTGILPYTSTFFEPSSRAHRQAQAAGSMVLYPPRMGTPSELIVDDQTGIVRDPSRWVDIIEEKVKSGDWERLGKNARDFAVSENWDVQAERFNRLFENILGEKK